MRTALKSPLLLIIFYALSSSAQMQNTLTDVYYTPTKPIQIGNLPDPVQPEPVDPPGGGGEVVSNPPDLGDVTAPNPPAPAPPVVAPPSDFGQGVTTTPSGTALKGGQAGVRLDACGAFSIGVKTSSSRECRKVVVSQNFVPFLINTTAKCVNVALRALNHKPAATIFLEQLRTFGDTKTPSGKWSMHSTGRAIDVSKIVITTTDGTTVSRSMVIGNKNDTFYNTFNKCWEDTNKARPDCQGSNAATGNGMIDWHDSDHHDHVHLSMPFCPPRSGISST